MKIAIIGLGLIGGSFAKGFKTYSDHEVYGLDIDGDTLIYAKQSGAMDDALTDEVLAACGLVIIALYPHKTVEFLEQKAPLLRKDALVIDTCGTKRDVCKAGFTLAARYGFTFVGGHPMAGTQFSGIKYARADLFKNASMVIVPPDPADTVLIERIKQVLAPLEFGKLTLSTAEEHDEIIAFTSQLAHIVSSAYIKSDTAKRHHGFSAGSYRDMTRVATLNEVMWTELFMQNRDNLVHELDNIIAALDEYRAALDAGDTERLKEILRQGTRDKALIDGTGVQRA